MIHIMLMNKKSIFGLCAMMMLALAACSRDDEVAQNSQQTPLYSEEDLTWSGEPHYTQIGEWNVSYDEMGRCIGASFYGTYDPLEKLYAAPSSVDELNGVLFDFDNDYEWKLDSIRDIPIWEGMPSFTRFIEYYSEYYKGVAVYSSYMENSYYRTDKGPRMTNSSMHYMTFDDLDVTPTISVREALQIFSAYQQAPIDDSWTCKLYAREYKHRPETGKTGVVEHRLVYEVLGPPAPHFMDWDLYDMSAHYKAEIDAHTGQIIVAGNSDNINY